MNEFLPQGFEELKSGQAYWRMKELLDGDNRIRILLRPICGWIDWKENKPYRYKADQKPSASFDNDKPIKPFWSCYVWDYVRKGCYILEINQSSILKTLSTLGNSTDWGDFREYDIKINKQGSGQLTRWAVIPLPPTPLDEAIVESLKEKPVNLSALFEGGDPWNDISQSPKKSYEAAFTTNEGASNMSHAAFLNSTSPCISEGEAIQLDNLIGSNEEYRKNVMSFLSTNFGIESIEKMPINIYPKIFDRATQLSHDQLSQEAMPF